MRLRPRRLDPPKDVVPLLSKNLALDPLTLLTSSAVLLHTIVLRSAARAPPTLIPLHASAARTGTSANVDAHHQILLPDVCPPKYTAITDKKQLSRYNITVDRGITLPETLAHFVKTLKRSREQEPSPHAQAIKDTRRAASVENEITARKMMEQHVLFRGEGYSSGSKGLTLKDGVNLIKDYLPTLPRVTALEL
ncbi:hypothetical protein K505DRAFT_363001 [Melanomma pulvis-pyrius CBS 109.77]|uniref:Uncharacterized protein n=1 Tax=Melanomma pulvis-pyrius CBS 109.77 TaxID=1314802 RepID=A0A6A6X8K5_9PLEO|nr:hypothetical protein K505DRAFT_363001 [Melanomma pulvis-pyrius CBS 109.77]